jgi:hypothetical protein
MTHNRQQLARGLMGIAAVLITTTAVQAQMQRIERQVPQIQQVQQLDTPGQGGQQAFALIHRGPIALNAPSSGEGLDPGWLVRLDLPPGKYLVSGSATFTRTDGALLPLDPSEESPMPGTVSVACELGGLDQTVPVEVYIDASPHHPYAAEIVPFNVAGTSGSGGIFLKCAPTGAARVSNIYLNALKVDRLTLRVE